MNSFEAQVMAEKRRLLDPPLITILPDAELRKRGTSKLVFILRKVTGIVHSLNNPGRGGCDCGDQGCEYYNDEMRPYWNAAWQVAPIYDAYRKRIKAILAERPNVIPRQLKRKRNRRNR